MLVLPGLVNAHHHGMAISTVQLGFPDPGPPEPGLRDTPFESWMATMLALDAVDPYLGTLCQGRAADRVRRHVAPAHALPLGRGRRVGRARLRPRAAARRCAPTASRVSASRSRRTGATARAWPTTATTRSSRRCRPSCASGRAVSRARACRPRPTSTTIQAARAGARRRSAAERPVRDHGAAVGERRARRGGRRGSRRARLPASICTRSRAALQRAWGDAFAGGRELERLARDRRARRPQRARPRRLAARLPTSTCSPAAEPTVVHNCVLEPAPRGRRRAAAPARRGRA